MKEAADNLKNSAKEAKDQLESLKEAFSVYDTAVEALNSCTKGTDEWN